MADLHRQGSRVYDDTCLLFLYNLLAHILLSALGGDRCIEVFPALQKDFLHLQTAGPGPLAHDPSSLVQGLGQFVAARQLLGHSITTQIVSRW